MILSTHGIIQGGVLNPILDDYPNAYTAYSFRKLRTAYTGDCIRVRRSNDNIETNIGFTSSGVLDTTALLTFTGSNTGFVTTWYDQSGNSRNAIQATVGNQPRIVISGVLQSTNGFPAFITSGANAGLRMTTAIAITNPYTIMHVAYLTSASSSGFRNFGALGANVSSLYYDPSANIALTSTGGIGISIAKSFPTRNELAFGINDGTSSSLSINQLNTSGTLPIFTALTQSISNVGSGTSSSPGLHQEVILYTSNQSANKSGLQSNINSFYGLY
jgi:hypothetical protein